MWNYSYLVAKQQQLDKQLSSCTSLEFNTKTGTLLYSLSSKEHSYDLNKGLDSEELLYINNRHRYRKDLYSILGRPSKTISYELSALEYLLEKDLKKDIKGYSFKGGVVWYTYKGNMKKVKVDQDQPAHNEDNLVCAEFLKTGGYIEEILGKFFRLKTPGLTIPYVTTLNNCNCNEFEAEGKCIHTRITNFIVRNRDLFTSI